MTTHKIAIIQCRDLSHNYDFDASEHLIRSITDWTEVDDETYQMLQNYRCASASAGKLYYVLTRPIDERAFVNETVADYIEQAQKAEAKLLAEKAVAARKTQERKLRKLAKDETARKKLFEELQKEFGE